AWQYPLLALGSALLVSGWWFWRNWTLYHDPTGLNVMLAIVGERSATWRDLLREWEGFRRAFWGVFGGMNVLMPAWVYRILDGWTLVVFLGFVFAFLRAVHARERTEVERWTGVLGYIGTVFVALLRWTMRTLASQGRLLFPALAPIGLVFWRGWTWWTDKISIPGWRRLLSGVPLAFLAFIALVAPPLWIAPVYDPTRVVRSTVPDDVTPHRVQFGQVVEMLGYRLQVPHPLLPGSEVQASLYFRRLDGPAQPWSLFVHLLDEVEVVLAQDDRYPMLGLVDMPRISPGTLWEEPVRLRVPDTAVAPAQVSLEWGFYNLQDGQRLPIAHVDPPQTRVLVGPWQLLPRPGPYPNPTSVVFGDRVELVGFEAAPRRLHPGDALHLVLYWRALRPMKHDYVVFTHILEPPDHIWGQEDRAPSVPTHLWKVGEVYREEYTLVLRPDTPPGLYEVEIGWYRPDTGERLLRPDGRNFLFLTRVRAVP
ncbi:MAG: hypothetical protein GXO55_06730, partial [Chloroflexi bacterium]|nr:hypothetical protein [Chloroflexota bacterium]